MSTEKHEEPPGKPNPDHPAPPASATQQEKRWTGDDDGTLRWNTGDEYQVFYLGITALNLNLAKVIADAHNATLSEPKPQKQTLGNEAPVASKAGDAPPQNTLLACPFCGSAADLERGSDKKRWYAGCPKCAFYFVQAASNAKVDVMREWNQRVAPSVVAGVGEHAMEKRE